jgi:hypothetical protein
MHNNIQYPITLILFIDELFNRSVFERCAKIGIKPTLKNTPLGVLPCNAAWWKFVKAILYSTINDLTT